MQNKPNYFTWSHGQDGQLDPLKRGVPRVRALGHQDLVPTRDIFKTFRSASPFLGGYGGFGGFGLGGLGGFG